jgi:hypothetical protein
MNFIESLSHGEMTSELGTLALSFWFSVSQMLVSPIRSFAASIEDAADKNALAVSLAQEQFDSLTRYNRYREIEYRNNNLLYIYI